MSGKNGECIPLPLQSYLPVLSPVCVLARGESWEGREGERQGYWRGEGRTSLPPPLLGVSKTVFCAARPARVHPATTPPPAANNHSDSSSISYRKLITTGLI